LGRINFQEKEAILKSTLFPDPPSSASPNWEKYKSKGWNWPKLTSSELVLACSIKIKGKIPSSDRITQEIINKAYLAIPDIFYKIYTNLIDYGFHPKCWRQVTRAILKKPSKLDYSLPKAYRVISLLNCFGKISERILAKRLSYLAETSSLLYNSQIGGRLKKSAIDIGLLLANKVEQNHLKGYKTSVLFLDIKGAFDHISKNQLLAILKGLNLLISLISWTSYFLEDRLLRLSFDGQIEQFTSISTNIP
jgi:hypothetical protein